MEALVDSDVRNKSLTRISMCNLALDSEWRIRKSLQLGSSMMRLFNFKYVVLAIHADCTDDLSSYTPL